MSNQLSITEMTDKEINILLNECLEEVIGSYDKFPKSPSPSMLPKPNFVKLKPRFTIIVKNNEYYSFYMLKNIEPFINNFKVIQYSPEYSYIKGVPCVIDSYTGMSHLGFTNYTSLMN